MTERQKNIQETRIHLLLVVQNQEIQDFCKREPNALVRIRNKS